MIPWRAVSTCLSIGTFSLAPMLSCGDDDGRDIDLGADLVLDVSPPAVTFASIVVGQDSHVDVTFKHVGTSGTLRLNSIVLETLSDEITIEKPSEGVIELEVGESAVVRVNYDPVDGLPDSGELVVQTNVGTTSGPLVAHVPIASVSSSGVLTALPNPLDFGDVDSGGSLAKTISLVNLGSDDATITSLNVQGGPEGDFSLSFAPTLPAVLAPNEALTFEVTYAPTGGNTDQGRVDVFFDIGDEHHEIDPPATLLGHEVGPSLRAFPNPVDFGYRPLDVTKDLALNLSNAGVRDLVITKAELAPGSSDTITFTGFPASGGATVQPTGVLPLQVHFTPKSGMVQTTAPIATLVLTSNDSTNGGEFEIPIFGRAEVPVIQVNPPDSLDFGFVAQNLTRDRDIAIFNAGNSPLTVTSVSLPNTSNGEYEILVDETWGPTASTPTSAVLQPQQSKSVKLRFTNKGAATGTAAGVVRVSSNDGNRPEWDVNLRAGRAGAPTCDIALVPLPKDFGIVPRGFRRSQTIRIVNQGSGDCSLASAFVNDCAGFFGFFGGNCPDPATVFQTGGTSDYYTITARPPSVQNGLKAGQSYDMEITFTPPDTAPIFGDETTDYAGFVGVRVNDPYSPTPLEPVIFPKAQAGSSPFPPNLHAKSGIAQLAVLPAELDFGLTTIGCHSQTLTVTAYNVGTAPLDVTDIKLEGCSAEFKVKRSPGLPLTLQPNGNDYLDIVYVPQDTSRDTCSIGFYVANEVTPTIVVPLEGRGTFETEQTDVFTQTTGQDVDILFVVDNSGSMQEEQQNIGNNFQAFISGATTWNNDYHIAVTTTDLEAESGRFVANNGAKRIVTRSNTGDFSKNVNVGTNGSGTEQGLAAAQAALSLPNTADSTTACTNDQACTAPEKCVDGFCGGPNRGFLREDAALEIVMVSDEEDQSPSDIAFYVNFFRAIKGFYNTNLMHIHSIVGDTPNGCGDAAAGFRYYDVSGQTGGATGSICNPSFSQSLSSIGDIAFGLRTQFFLSRLPDPSTITVSVAGTSCQGNSGANWLYEPLSNSVVFSETGGCMPQAGQQVQVHYSTICLLE